MTFKDLQKLVESQSQSGPEQNQLLQRLQGKPFWVWDHEQHKQEYIKAKRDCCFNHIIGLPTKDGHDMPLLPHQRTLYDALQNHKHIWIKKSRGLGVTEFLLRHIAWCCVSSKFRDNSRVCVITGPRIRPGRRPDCKVQGLFEKANSPFLGNDRTNNTQTKSTVAFLNGVKVEAFET